MKGPDSGAAFRRALWLRLWPWLRPLAPLAALIGALPLAVPLVASRDAASGARGGGRPTLTFLVAGDSHFGASDSHFGASDSRSGASDSHFGAGGMEERNRILIEEMNRLPGLAYPEALGGTVGVPRGVLFMGDMTDSSQPNDWRTFERLYGLTGHDGLLRYPVFEAIGNHDIIGDSPVPAGVERRHGALAHSWDWDDVHFVCLGLHPDADNLAWFKRDLRRAGRRRPVILFFHYSIAGPYSDFWEPSDKEALARALESVNVLALFHGHFHHAGHYRWRGHEVFLPGSPRHFSHELLVVRVSGRSLSVGFRDFDTGRWTDTYTTTIRR